MAQVGQGGYMVGGGGGGGSAGGGDGALLNNPKYVTELRNSDVLFGRGSGPNDHEGNIRFRNLVAERKSEYMATNHRLTKAKIAKEIVDGVLLVGGRFLKKLEVQDAKELGFPEGLDAYEVADQDTIMEKAKQALRQNSQKAKGDGDSGLSIKGKPPITPPIITHVPPPKPKGSTQIPLETPDIEPIPLHRPGGYSNNSNNFHQGHRQTLSPDRGQNPTGLGGGTASQHISLPLGGTLLQPVGTGLESLSGNSGVVRGPANMLPLGLDSPPTIPSSWGGNRGCPAASLSSSSAPTMTSRKTDCNPTLFGPPADPVSPTGQLEDSMLAYLPQSVAYAALVAQQQYQQQQQPPPGGGGNRAMRYQLQQQQALQQQQKQQQQQQQQQQQSQEDAPAPHSYYQQGQQQQFQNQQQQYATASGMASRVSLDEPNSGGSGRGGSQHGSAGTGSGDDEPLSQRPPRPDYRAELNRRGSLQMSDLMDSFSRMKTIEDSNYMKKMSNSTETMGTIEAYSVGSYADMSLGSSTFSFFKWNDSMVADDKPPMSGGGTGSNTLPPSNVETSNNMGPPPPAYGRETSRASTFSRLTSASDASLPSLRFWESGGIGSSGGNNSITNSITNSRRPPALSSTVSGLMNAASEGMPQSSVMALAETPRPMSLMEEDPDSYSMIGRSSMSVLKGFVNPNDLDDSMSQAQQYLAGDASRHIDHNHNNSNTHGGSGGSAGASSS